MSLYAGIDNGLDGAIAIIGEDGVIHDTQRMPTIKLGKGRKVDIREVQAILSVADTVALECAQKHSAGNLALCSTWFTYGHLVALLELTEKRHHLLNPRDWQKEFWTTPKMAKGQKFDTKAAALNAARKLWPTETFLATSRSSVPHDGIVDALLIAEYARRKRL